MEGWQNQEPVMPDHFPSPAMVTAGVKEFCTYDPRFEDMDDAIARVWLAMEHVRLSQVSSESRDGPKAA